MVGPSQRSCVSSREGEGIHVAAPLGWLLRANWQFFFHPPSISLPSRCLLLYPSFLCSCEHTVCVCNATKHFRVFIYQVLGQTLSSIIISGGCVILVAGKTGPTKYCPSLCYMALTSVPWCTVYLHSHHPTFHPSPLRSDRSASKRSLWLCKSNAYSWEDSLASVGRGGQRSVVLAIIVSAGEKTVQFDPDETLSFTLLVMKGMVSHTRYWWYQCYYSACERECYYCFLPFLQSVRSHARCLGFVYLRSERSSHSQSLSLIVVFCVTYLYHLLNVETYWLICVLVFIHFLRHAPSLSFRQLHSAFNGRGLIC